MGWGGGIPSAPQANNVEGRGKNDRRHKVQDDNQEGEGHGGEAKAADRDRIDRLESRLDEEGSAQHFCDKPANQQGPAIEPVSVEAQEDRRERLENPDASEQLEVDDLLSRDINDEEHRAKLYDERSPLRYSGFLALPGTPVKVLLVDVAGNRLPAAIDITEAGTSAPIEMAAKAKPANQLGNSWLMRAGTAPFAPKGARGFTCAAIAMYPVRASSPSISE